MFEKLNVILSFHNNCLRLFFRFIKSLFMKRTECNGVFTLTETKTETDKIAFVKLCAGVHTAQRQRRCKFPLASAHKFISICIGYCLGVGQC